MGRRTTGVGEHPTLEVALVLTSPNPAEPEPIPPEPAPLPPEPETAPASS